MTTDFGKPKTYTESLERLRADTSKGGAPRPKVAMDGTLPLKAIKFATRVFQPRTFDGQFAASKAHIRALADSIRGAEDHRLDPIVVWWSGDRWIVIDGHHRLDAYRWVTKDKKRSVEIKRVPVEVFEGDLNAAIGEATRLNSKDKLPMSKHDKLERAWKLISHEDAAWSVRKIAKVAGVAPRTVQNMSTKLKELKADDPEVNLLDLSWQEVRTGQQERVCDEDWLDKQAKVFVHRLGKAFGPYLLRKPAIVAEGIQQYSGALPKLLVAEWGFDRVPDEFDCAMDMGEPFVNEGEEEPSDF